MKTMKTIEDLIKRKKELGYTNEMISERSGVPLSTVNKIFGGITAKPRYNTLQSIQCALFPEAFTQKEAAQYKEIAENLSLDFGSNVSDTSLLDEYSWEVPLEEYKKGFERVLSWKKQGEYTVDDLEELPYGVRMELIDGVLYDLASPSPKHQFIAGQIYHELCSATIAKGKSKCVPFIAPLDVQILNDNKNMLQPDVMLICDKEKYADEKRIHGGPDFVVEVLSPSTKKYDSNIKIKKYWEAGVREFWLINIKDEEVWVYKFGNGADKGAAIEKHSFEEQIPLGISDGKIVIDFKSIKERLHAYFG